ncbi:MAG: MFS transporter [Clostridiales bacterium]|nr:MFS transporter [Clostridiales bacterium]
MKGKSGGSFGDKLKNAIGIEGDTKTVLKPMLSYSLANISWEGGSYVLGLYYLAFLTYVEGLSTGQAAMVVMFKSIWDAVTDPAMGIITDRTRSKLGRHRRYILIGAVPMGVTFFMLWYSFGISGMGNTNATMLYYLIAYMLYSTVTTVLTVPHTAMLPEMAPEYFLRTQYNSVGMLMNSVGQITSFLLIAVTTGLFSTQEFNPGMRSTFMVLGIILGIFYILPILLCYRNTSEPSSLDMEVPKFNGRYLAHEYRQVFRNKSFRQYFMISVMVMFAVGFYSNSKVYFIREVMDKWTYYNILITISGIAEFSAFPLNYWLTKKFGKQKCSYILTPLWLAGLSFGLFMRPDSGTSVIQIGSILIFVQAILYNFGFSGLRFTSSNIFPDITDVDEMITGRRREGVMATFSTFIKKLSSGLITGFVCIILEWFGVSVNDSSGLLTRIPKAPELFGESVGAEFGIRFTHAFLPMSCVVLALLAVRNYTMTKREHTMIRAAIRMKKETGSVTLTPEQIKRCEKIAGQPWENMWLGRDNTENCPLVQDETGKYIFPSDAEAEKEHQHS